MRRECVLVVDDDQMFREFVSLSLRDLYAVKQATSAAQAMHVVRREPIATVVLDYRLPDGTGLDALAAIRSERPDLPVIMVTGYGSEATCASAFRLGVRDYLPKPFSVVRLRQTLASVLAREGAGPASARSPNDSWAAPAESDRPEVAIEKAAVLIQQRYWEHLTLPSLAREVGVSKYRLSRRFHEVMGVTLRGYLLRARLERAKELLATTREHITEVALAVGYSDLPRFDKLFKRYTGVTPTAYRGRWGPRR